MGAEQKVVIITGASQGIGADLVKGFRDRNYRVVANSRSIKPSSDPDILAVAGDIADPKTAERIVEQALARFGRIDSLVNNAGIFVAKPFTDYTEEDFAAVLSINVGSFFHVTRRVAAEMVKQGSGAVVNVGSIGGLRHLGHDHVGYSASKAGLVQFTRQIAVRYAPHNIRCNTVIPGMIDTPLLEHRVSRQKGRADLATLRNEAKVRVPLGRRGDAWDVAYAALFLASDEAKYVTGTEILVDGGLMARSA